jgi:transposase
MYSDKERDVLFKMRDAGDSWAAIGRALGKSKASVKKYYQRNAPNRNLEPKPKVSKRITNGRVGRLLKSIVLENPKASISMIEFKLKEKFEEVGATNQRLPKKTTIREFLKRNSIIVVKLLRKPLLRQINQEKRLLFAHEALNTPALLQRLVATTIWSDETTVRSHPNGRDIWIRCHSSTKREDLPVNPQLQAGGISVMFWGCFSTQGVGPLVALEGSQNQHTYKDLLQKYLIPEIQVARSQFGVQMTFMQDNAPCHKARMVMDFLARNRVPMLDWPPQSPDLNPIENLWAYIKRKRAEKFGPPSNKAQLIDQVMTIWDELDIDLVKKLTESISNRLKEVIRLNGKYTKY